MPRDIRHDTALTADPGRAGPVPRAHPRRLEGRLHLRRRLDVRRVARDGTASRAHDLSLVTANAIFLAPGAARDRSPSTSTCSATAGARRRWPPTCASPASTRPRCASTGCSAPRTTPSSRTRRCGSPRCRGPATSSPRCFDRPNPFGEINFHEQTEWRPASPLDDPGKGHFLSWVRLRESEPHLLSLAVHGDVLGPAVGRALGPPDEPRHVHGAVPRDRHPFRPAAGHGLGAAGDRGLAHRRRLRHRARPGCGTRPATSAPSPPRPPTCAATSPSR